MRKNIRMSAASVKAAKIATRVDVAIIGGGPGGLATAAAVRSAFGKHVGVKVYESLPEYTLQGSAVGLAANAQHALEAIHPDLLARFLKYGVPISGLSTYDLEGNFVSFGDAKLADNEHLYEKYGKITTLLGWHEIRQLLFEYLPSGIVEFNKQMTEYEEDEEGVIIHFDHGQPSVHAKVLIGADGYFSRVRKQCLNDGPPMFAGCVMWRARIADPGDHGDTKLVSWRDQDQPVMSGPFAMLMHMGTLESTKHKPWTWILGAPLVTLKEAGVHFDPEVRGPSAIQGDAQSGSALENALKIFENMSKSLMDIVKKTDPTTVTQHGLYMRPLTDPALHPLVAKPPPAASPDTPPKQEKKKTTSPTASDSADTVATATVKELGTHSDDAEEPAAWGIEQAATDAAGSSPQNANADKQADTSAAANVQSTAELTGAAAEMKGPSVPSGTPAVTKGNPTDSVGSSSAPKGASAPVEACSTTKGGSSTTSPSSSDAIPGKGTQSLAGGHVGWGRGRVTLLGDAAHATIPNGQGLALALEDAVVLAWHLRRQGLSQQALRSYELERPDRVKTIHLKGVDNATFEDRERYLYKPTFKPLWCQQEQATEETTCITDFQP